MDAETAQVRHDQHERHEQQQRPRKREQRRQTALPQRLEQRDAHHHDAHRQIGDEEHAEVVNALRHERRIGDEQRQRGLGEQHGGYPEQQRKPRRPQRERHGAPSHAVVQPGAVVRARRGLEAVAHAPQRDERERLDAQRRAEQHLPLRAAPLGRRAVDDRLLDEREHLHEHGRHAHLRHLGQHRARRRHAHDARRLLALDEPP